MVTEEIQDNSNQQPTPPDKVASLYTGLLSAGLSKDNLGSQDEFRSALADSTKASKIYDSLTSAGLTKDNLGGDKDAFVKTFSAPSRAPFRSVTETLLQPQSSKGIVQDLGGQYKEKSDNGFRIVDALSTSTKKTPRETLSIDQSKTDPVYLAQKKELDDNAKRQAEINARVEAPFKKKGEFLGGLELGARFAAGKVLQGTVQGGRGLVAAGIMVDKLLGTVTGDDKLLKGIDEKQPDVDAFFEDLNHKAALGIDERYKSDDVSEAVGGFLKLAPAIIASRSVGGSAFTFQGIGDADKDIAELKAQGVKFNNHSDDLYRVMNGGINYLLMDRLNAHTFFSKMPSDVKSTVVSKLSIEALNDVIKSGKDINAETLTNAMKDKALSFSDKLQKQGIEALKSYALTSADLTAFNVASYAAKKTTNAVSGNKVFDIKQTDLVNSIAHSLMVDAPLFAGVGVARQSGLLFDKSPLKNSVLEDLKRDQSPQTVSEIKNGLTQHLEGVSPEDMQNSLNQVDKLVDAVKKLPLSIIPEKNHNKAIDLSVGRSEIKQQLDELRTQRESGDEALAETLAPQEQLLQDKYDQANDKIRDLTTGNKTTYSKGVENEDGKFFKTTNGVKEEITPSRYDLETVEKKPEPLTSGIYDNYAKSIGATEKAGDGHRTKDSDAVDVGISPSKESPSEAIISHIEVPEETRGMGLAKEKLQDLSTKADDQGITLKANLNDRGFESQDSAKRLFESAGFKETESGQMERSPAKINEQYIPEILNDNSNISKDEKINAVGEISNGQESGQISNGESKTSSQEIAGEKNVAEEKINSENSLSDSSKSGFDKFFDIFSKKQQLPVKKYTEADDYRWSVSRRFRKPEIVKQELSRAINAGEISKEHGELAIDLINKNPEIFENLGLLVYDSIHKDYGGFFKKDDADTNGRQIKVFKQGPGGSSEKTATHELLHHTEGYLPQKVRKAILREWFEAVEDKIDETRDLIKKEKNPFKKAKLEKVFSYLGGVLERQVSEDNTLHRKLYDQVGKDVPYHFYQYFTPSEWWAVNASEMFARLKKDPNGNSWIQMAKDFYQGLIRLRAEKKIVGSTFSRDKSTDAVRDGLSAVIEGKTLSKNTRDTLSRSRKLMSQPLYDKIDEEIKSNNDKIASLDAEIDATYKSLVKKLGSGLSVNGKLDAIGDLIKLGSLYIQKGAITFTEFAKNIREAYKDATGKDLQLTDKEIARDIYKPAKRNAIDPTKTDDPIGQRGFGERQSGNVPEETQKYIDEDPEHDYKKQVLDDIKSELNQKSLEDLDKDMEFVKQLGMFDSDNNLSVLAAKTKMDRALATGDTELYNDIFKQLDKAGTTLGQLLRQFAEIKGTTPEFFISAVEKKLETSGRYLTPEQKGELQTKVEDFLKKSIDAKEKWIKAAESLDPKDMEEAVSAKKLAELSNIDLAKKQRDFEVMDFWDTASAIMQGNLLTTVSQIANPIYNLAFAPLRAGTRAIASVLDAVVSKTFGVDRTISYDVNQVRYATSGFAEGFSNAVKTARHGYYPGDSSKIEQYRGLRPIDALVDVFTGKNLPKSYDKGQEFVDRFLTKPLEGIFGGPAEIMYRGLAFGDKPFYQSAYRAKLAEIANLRGLKGDELTKFEMLSDPKSMKVATEYADEATFQNDSGLSKVATGGINMAVSALRKVPIVGGPIRFMLRSILPFVKTPTNVIVETANYVMPEISAIQTGIGFYNLRKAYSEMNTQVKLAEKDGKSLQAIAKIKKNGADKIKEARKQVIESIGKGMVAKTLQVGAMWIVGNGLFTGSLQQDQKKRALQYEVGKPNSVNVDAMQRGMNTGNYNWIAGDKFLSLDKFGMFGAAVAIAGNTKDKEEEAGQQSDFLTDLTYSVPSVLKFSLDQSFLKGTNTMMDAISTGRYDQIAPNTVAAMYSVFVPNSWSTLVRANREYMVNKKGETIGESIENVIKEKTFADTGLPSQVGLWGQKVYQSPEGRNPYVYQLLDVTKYNKLTDDPVTKELLDVYKAVKDPAIIPSKPDGNFVMANEKFKLTQPEIQKRQEIVGKERYDLFKQVIETEGYKKSTYEIKSVILNKVLTAASSAGDGLFQKYYIEQHPNAIMDAKLKKK